MNNLPIDSELETELQEMYILARHWLQDISFMEEELQFFKNVLNKYEPQEISGEPTSKSTLFNQKINELEQHLVSLKTKIPAFLTLLEPHITDLKKAINLGFLNDYNTLEAELRVLFAAVKLTKKDLFSFAESGMISENRFN
jgi:hypothetical protein